MTANGYLLLHGWQNRRPEGHWHNWLSRRLAEAGHQVAYPQLPDPDEPDLEIWLAVLRTEFARLEGAERVVIGHSLGAVTLLNALAVTDLQDYADRVLVVAPPSVSVMKRHPAITDFAPPAQIAARVPVRLVGSDGDEWCPEGVGSEYAPMLGLGDADVDIVPGGGHLSMDDGYGAWPSVLEWCLEPATRIIGNR